MSALPTSPTGSEFYHQIQELISANGWETQLSLEIIQGVDPSSIGARTTVRVRLPAHHPVSPSEIVNEYTEGVHPLEQIQQECLRALRTGHPGI